MISIVFFLHELSKIVNTTYRFEIDVSDWEFYRITRKTDFLFKYAQLINGYFYFDRNLFLQRIYPTKFIMLYILETLFLTLGNNTVFSNCIISDSSYNNYFISYFIFFLIIHSLLYYLFYSRINNVNKKVHISENSLYPKLYYFKAVIVGRLIYLNVETLIYFNGMNLRWQSITQFMLFLFFIFLKNEYIVR